MKDIEQILRDSKPELPEEGAFLIVTNARLSKVEGIKESVEAEQRRGRKALIIALVAGIVLGCAVTLFVTFFPVSSIAENLPALAQAASALQAGKEYFLIPIAACAIALSLLFMQKRIFTR